MQTIFPEFDPTIAEEFGYQVTQSPSFLGIPLIDTPNILHLLMRFGFNLIISWIIVHFFYYKKSGRRDYFLTFMLFSSSMFLLIFLMENVKLQIGLTLGLFAIFGVIRYRTETVPIREMTYLFIIITVSVINGLALNISYAELVLANLLITGLIWICEYAKTTRNASVKVILYDKIDLIKPEKRQELKKDLESRLGFEIQKLEIGHVDFIKDAAYIKVYYQLPNDELGTIDSVTKFDRDSLLH